MSGTAGFPSSMWAVRLHGPRDLRLEEVAHPGLPGPGQVLVRVRCTGICGSDLHSFADGRIGDTAVVSPLVLGHEFSGVVEAVGEGSESGYFEALRVGQRVAVDPAQPCHRCEYCEQGLPNLCRRLHFCGNHPDGGSLCEWMHMPSRSCFPVPDSMDDETAALLEPLGVALHAVDLARPRVGDSMAVLGAGPIGLMILQVARLAGADPVYVTDPLPWRLEAAARLGAVVVDAGQDPVGRVRQGTGGRGVDLAVEAAWAGSSVMEAAEMCRLGGRLVVVGIPGDDVMTLKASTARRKGLTIKMSRRMKHVYPRATALVERGAVDLKGLVSHRFGLVEAVEAFQRNAAYEAGVLKVMVRSEG